MNDSQAALILTEVKQINVRMENMQDQFQAVVERVSDMQKSVSRIPKIEEDIVILKQDMTVFKAIAKDISNMANNHERRITRLEHL